MTIPVVRKILEKNEQAAAQNRARFDELGLTVINVLGGAGCGKTSLLEAVIPVLKPELRVGVLEGDIATTRDSERIAALDVPVVQLLTEGGCHLTAAHVQRALGEMPLPRLDLLLIENVGNPICPANFDLGEHGRIAVLSVAEGDDKPAKYPLLFRSAHLIVLSKFDLLSHVKYDLQRVLSELDRINPQARVVGTDIRTRCGLDKVAAWLREQVASRGTVVRDSRGRGRQPVLTQPLVREIAQ